MTRFVIAVASVIGGVGVGVGYAAADDPIVFLTVPAGIILVGASIGLAAGLAVGLAEVVRYRLRSALGVPMGVEGLGSRSEPEFGLSPVRSGVDPADSQIVHSSFTAA
jgi:hypothetical protein